MTAKLYISAALLTLVTVAAGCSKNKVQKDVQDYYPKLTATDVTIEPDGSAKITGNVSSSGSGDLLYAGFCMDETPHPQMHINQKLVNELDGTSFTATYTNLDAMKKYYVRSFAANEHGYAYGEEAVIENPGMDTNAIPCHPSVNTMTVTTGTSTKVDSLRSYSVDELDPIEHEFSVNSPTYSWGMRFEFNRKPTSGKYKIWETSGGGPNTVSILFSDPNNGSSYMENGGEIYVQQVGANRIKVWMCHQNAFFDWYVTTSFTTK